MNTPDKHPIDTFSSDAFGSPEARKRKTERYFLELVHQHGELLVRQVLDTLSREPGFIFAKRLRQSGPLTAPLNVLLTPFEFPQLALSFVHVDEQSVTVDVSEGVPLAGSGTRFCLRRASDGLTLDHAEDLWIS